ncbi:MAG: zf-HC2 domain-containing protein, partial [bacterium]
MKKCKLDKSAHLYEFGMLSGKAAARFEKHIAACFECRRIVKETRAIKTICGEMAPPQPPPGIEDKLIGSVVRTASRRTPPAHFVPQPLFDGNLVPAAACLATLLFIAVLVTPRGGMPPTTGASGGVETRLAQLEMNMIFGDDEIAFGSYYEKLNMICNPGHRA